ncbi:MAG: tetratricopeptide repeat protein, partial [Ignavibacteriales bacterium]
MQKSILFVLGILILSLPFLAFDCSSTELTSAKLYIQQKNWDRALEVLQAEVQKNPKSDEGYYLLGTVYSELDQPEKTLEAFDNSLAISDKYSKNIKEYRTYHWAEYFNRGVSLFQRGSKTADKDSTKMYYDMSIEAYHNAIMFQPDSGETYRNLAFVYLTTGQTEASVEPLKKLIELENAEEGYQYLGEVYYSLGAEIMNNFKSNSNSADSVKAMEYFNSAIMTLDEGLAKYPDNT